MNNYLIPKDKLQEYNGEIVVSSRTISEIFEKQHKHVLADIKNIGARFNINLIKSTYKCKANNTRPEYLINDELFKILYTRYMLKTRLPQYEIEFFKKLEEALTFYNIKLKRQFYIKPYRIDAYIQEIKMFIEFDEFNHKGYDKQKEKEREQFILNKYPDHKILRLNHLDGDMYNIAKVLDNIK